MIIVICIYVDDYYYYLFWVGNFVLNVCVCRLKFFIDDVCNWRDIDIERGVFVVRVGVWCSRVFV